MDKIHQRAVSVSVWLGLPSIPEHMHEVVMDNHEPSGTMEVGECD
jgi:hypothetical protein